MTEESQLVVGISTDEASQMLGVMREHVYRLLSQGRLTRHGGKHRCFGLDRAEVEALSLAHWRVGRPRSPHLSLESVQPGVASQDLR